MILPPLRIEAGTKIIPLDEPLNTCSIIHEVTHF